MKPTYMLKKYIVVLVHVHVFMKYLTFIFVKIKQVELFFNIYAVQYNGARFCCKTLEKIQVFFVL